MKSVLDLKSLLNKDRSWAFRAMMLLAAGALVVGLWARLYNLGFPPRLIFDELYFPDFARKYLEGIYKFDLHPPLGKFLIAASIALLGDNPFAWRWMPAVFGCSMIPLGALVGWYYFKERVAALLLGTFIAGETFLVAYSRTGVMDGFLVFFMLATLLAALMVERRGELIWVAVLLGLSIAVKWAVFPVAIPVGYILWRKGLFKPFLASLWISAIVYVAIVYIGALVSVTSNPWQAWVWMWDWHLQAAERITAAIPNPLASPWWSWPLMLHPIRFWYGVSPDGEVRTISSIGNPILWWSGTLAVIAGLLEIARRMVLRKWVADDPLVPIVLGYVFLLLPWVPSTRIPYIYNYLPSYAFALLALVYWMCFLWRRRPVGPWVVVAFTACAVATFLFFLPMATGFPMTFQGVQWRVWLESWSPEPR
ncbi:MAG: phospholipid carrier-dependent glycosyltransferase [Actinomycetota bacterium]|nr:phospholipid carrier-dependent glycosyltransferase [Actinomycetota bacterium]